MAKIRINLNHTPLDGETVAFKAPCDASQITGLIIYYPNENNVTTSQEFTLNDANGGDIGVVDNIFAAGAIVKIILDTDVSNAYVQNPDTNTYLEGRFENKSPKGHKHTKSEITDFPTSMPASDVYSWAKAASKPTYTASEVGAAAASHGNHVPATETANNARFLRNDNTWQAVTPANIGASSTGHKHTKSEITDFPTSMTPTAHNQAASTITAGTFAGQVVANSSGQTPGTSLLRNSKLVSAETNPTVNGEIFWLYE